MKTLLILLIGEMATPFSLELERALPSAFPDGVPEVQLGENAPPGRSVAWVTLSNHGDDVELLLHTARIPGDLRRLLHFGPKDTTAQRATAVAFAVANLVRQREADLAALVGSAPPPHVEVDAGVDSQGPPAEPLEWSAAVAPYGALNVGVPSWGAGVEVELSRSLTPWLALGLHVDATFLGAPRAQVWAPSAALEASLSPDGPAIAPVAVFGLGGAGFVFRRGDEQYVSFVGMARLAGGVRFELTRKSQLRFLAAAQATPATFALSVRNESAGVIGPITVRLEIGYQGRF